MKTQSFQSRTLASALALACLPLAAGAVCAQSQSIAETVQSESDTRPAEPTLDANVTGTSPLSARAVNDADIGLTDRAQSGAAMLRAQILLERAHFSPGQIDGAYGSNTRKAIAGFQRYHDMDATGRLDAATWKALNRDVEPALLSYTIAAADIDGPFSSIPSDMMAKAELSRLGYESAAEALGEKFHASPTLLHKLNPGKALDDAGARIVAPNVAAAAPLPEAAQVIVDKSDSTVLLADAEGNVYAQFPATTGSAHDPLPLGTWEIKGVAKDPAFHYNPDLFWDAQAGDAKATIPPGPNNPVGVVWIDLSKPHYGIHGTPVPSTIGKTQSHGCIRLTNWSAMLVADAVGPGTPALLRE